MNGVFMQKRSIALLLIAVACLAALPYLRSLGLPPIEDDYIQIHESRKYGHPSDWGSLAADALYRCRATSIVITYATEQIFGFNQQIFRLQSVLFHVLNALLIVSLGYWRPLGYRISFAAAALWALAERHHEAVLWYAALPEQLVFFFVLAALYFWLRWWQDGTRWAYAASMACYLLALLSKESAVVFCGLAFLPLIFDYKPWRRAATALVPAIGIAILYFLLNLTAQDDHLHWKDGTFRPGWQFALVMFNSINRLFWFWGTLGLIALAFWRREVNWRLIAFAALWIVICLAPYSLLSYMPRVPSRHVYLASLGRAFMLAVALGLVWRYRRVTIGLCGLFVLYNIAYVSFPKHEQFLRRAQVTEAVVEAAGALDARSYSVSCFPHDPQLAELAIHVRLNVPLANVNARRDGDCSTMQVRGTKRPVLQ
jgi:hypothetical protein